MSTRSIADAPDTKPVPLYGRVSTVAQAKHGLSIEMQKEDLPPLREANLPRCAPYPDRR